eukprot:CFRG6186T1
MPGNTSNDTVLADCTSTNNKLWLTLEGLNQCSEETRRNVLLQEKDKITCLFDHGSFALPSESGKTKFEAAIKSAYANKPQRTARISEFVSNISGCLNLDHYESYVLLNRYRRAMTLLGELHMMVFTNSELVKIIDFYRRERLDLLRAVLTVLFQGREDTSFFSDIYKEITTGSAFIDRVLSQYKRLSKVTSPGYRTSTSSQPNARTNINTNTHLTTSTNAINVLTTPEDPYTGIHTNMRVWATHWVTELGLLWDVCMVYFYYAQADSISSLQKVHGVVMETAPLTLGSEWSWLVRTPEVREGVERINQAQLLTVLACAGLSMFWDLSRKDDLEGVNRARDFGESILQFCPDDEQALIDSASVGGASQMIIHIAYLVMLSASGRVADVELKSRVLDHVMDVVEKLTTILASQTSSYYITCYRMIVSEYLNLLLNVIEKNFELDDTTVLQTLGAHVYAQDPQMCTTFWEMDGQYSAVRRLLLCFDDSTNCVVVPHTPDDVYSSMNAPVYGYDKAGVRERLREREQQLDLYAHVDKYASISPMAVVALMNMYKSVLFVSEYGSEDETLSAINSTENVYRILQCPFQHSWETSTSNDIQLQLTYDTQSRSQKRARDVSGGSRHSVWLWILIRLYEVASIIEHTPVHYQSPTHSTQTNRTTNMRNGGIAVPCVYEETAALMGLVYAVFSTNPNLLTNLHVFLEEEIQFLPHSVICKLPLPYRQAGQKFENHLIDAVFSLIDACVKSATNPNRFMIASATNDWSNVLSRCFDFLSSSLSLEPNLIRSYTRKIGLLPVPPHSVSRSTNPSPSFRDVLANVERVHGTYSATKSFVRFYGTLLRLPSGLPALVRIKSSSSSPSIVEVVPRLFLQMRYACPLDHFQTKSLRAINCLKEVLGARHVDVLHAREVGSMCCITFDAHAVARYEDSLNFEQFEVATELRVIDVYRTSSPNDPYEEDMRNTLAFLINEIYGACMGWRYNDILEMHQIACSVIEVFESVLRDLPILTGDVFESDIPETLPSVLLHQCMYDDRASNLHHTLLKTVCNGKEQLRGLYTLGRLKEAQALEQLVIRTFRLLNVLLDVALSDENERIPALVSVMLCDGGVGDGNTPCVKAISEYITHKSQCTELGKLPVLAVNLLSKLCEFGALSGAPRLSMAIYFDDNKHHLRNIYTERLCNPDSDPELRLALAEFYSIVMDTQPGLAFMFLDVQDSKTESGNYVMGKHSCLKVVFESLKTPASIDGRLLHGIVWLLSIMWQTSADYRHVHYLRQWGDGALWELMGKLMGDCERAEAFIDIENKTAAEAEELCYLTRTRGIIVSIVALELYTNYQRERTTSHDQSMGSSTSRKNKGTQTNSETPASTEGRLRNKIVSEMNPKLKTLVKTLLNTELVEWFKSLHNMSETTRAIACANGLSVSGDIYQPRLQSFKRDVGSLPFGRVLGSDYVYDTKLLSHYLNNSNRDKDHKHFVMSVERLNALLSAIDCQMYLLRSLKTLLRASEPYTAIKICGSSAPSAPGPIELSYETFLTAPDGLLCCVRKFHRFESERHGSPFQEIEDLAYTAAEAYKQALYALLSRTLYIILTSWIDHTPSIAAIENVLTCIGAVSRTVVDSPQLQSTLCRENVPQTPLSSQSDSSSLKNAIFSATTPQSQSTSSIATPLPTPSARHLPNPLSSDYVEPMCGMLDDIAHHIQLMSAHQPKSIHDIAGRADIGVGATVGVNVGSGVIADDGTNVGSCRSMNMNGDAGVGMSVNMGAPTSEDASVIVDEMSGMNVTSPASDDVNKYQVDFFAGLLSLLVSYDRKHTYAHAATHQQSISKQGRVGGDIGKGIPHNSTVDGGGHRSILPPKPMNPQFRHSLYRILESCCFVVYQALLAGPDFLEPTASYVPQLNPTVSSNGLSHVNLGVNCALKDTTTQNITNTQNLGSKNGISSELLRLNILTVETIIRILLSHTHSHKSTTHTQTSKPTSTGTPTSVVWRVLNRPTMCALDPLYLNREYAYGSIFEPLLSNINKWVKTKRNPLLIGSCLKLFTTVASYREGANIFAPLNVIQTLSTSLESHIQIFEKSSCLSSNTIQPASMHGNVAMSERINNQLYGAPMQYTGLPSCTFDGPIAYYLQDKRHNQWHTVFCQVLGLYTSLLETLKARVVAEAINFLLLHYDRLMRCLRRSNDSSGRVVTVAEMEELTSVSAFLTALARSGIFSWRPEIHLRRLRDLLDNKMEQIPRHVIETVQYYTTLLSKACDFEDTQLVIPVTHAERDLETRTTKTRLLSAKPTPSSSSASTHTHVDSCTNKGVIKRSGNPLLRKCELSIHTSLAHLMHFLKILTPPVISRAHVYEPSQDILRGFRAAGNIRSLSNIAAYYGLCINLTMNTNNGIANEIGGGYRGTSNRHPNVLDEVLNALRQKIPVSRDFCLYVLLNQERLIWYENTDPIAYKDLFNKLSTEFTEMLEISENMATVGARPAFTPGLRRPSSMSPGARKQSVFRKQSKALGSSVHSPTRPSGPRQSENDFWHRLVEDRPRPETHP